MAFICVVMGWEPFNKIRMAGVAVAFCGCLMMVFLAPSEEQQEEKDKEGQSMLVVWIGNLLFFVNCLCDPSYVIITKKLLHTFRPLAITAYSYFVSSIIMGAATLVSLVGVPKLMTTSTTTEESVWISGDLIPPLAVSFNSGPC